MVAAIGWQTAPPEYVKVGVTVTAFDRVALQAGGFGGPLALTVVDVLPPASTWFGFAAMSMSAGANAVDTLTVCVPELVTPSCPAWTTILPGGTSRPFRLSIAFMRRHASAAGPSAVLFGAMAIAGEAMVGDSVRADLGQDGSLHAVLTVLVPGGMAAAGGVIGIIASRRVRAGSLAAQSRHLLAWSAGGLCVAMGAALAAASRSPECVRAFDTTVLCGVAVIGELVSLIAASASATMFWGRRALCRAPLRLREHAGPVPGPFSLDLGIGEQVWTAPCPESPYRRAVAPEVQFVGDPFATLRSLQLDVAGALLCALAAACAVASFALHSPLALRM